MINDETVDKAVEIILDRILSPVIYMYADEAIEFICFADGNTQEQDFLDAEAALMINLGISAEIIDIRSFDEADRVEITQTAELVYAQSDLMKTLFESAMAADKERVITEKTKIIDRKADTGSYYLS